MNKTLIMIGLISLVLLSVVSAAENATLSNSMGEVKEAKKEIKEDIKNLNEEIKELREENRNLILQINPEKSQVSIGERATFIITIKDMHENSICPGGLVCTEVISQYKYQLSAGGDKLNFDFETSEIVLSPGEKRQLKLSVTSDEAGEFIFAVKAEGQDVAQKARGILIVSSDNRNDTIVDSSFFIGNGFLLSENEDKGESINLKILLKDNILSGKISISEKVYQIKGTLSGESVNFEILEINSGESRGTFSGNYKKFNSFILLRGSLNIDGEEYVLTAMSENKLVFRNVEVTENKEITRIKKGEVIVVNEYAKEEGNETYFRPVNVERLKILGIIPNPWGKKVLNVEVIENGKTNLQKIKDKESKEFGVYTVKANNLEDEDNIDLEITKKEA